ncbi:MAG: threonine/serine dehydratase [Chloroflexota bacterium]
MTDLGDIQRARTLVSPHIHSTPVTFDEKLGVWLKWENQQTTGSFKLRGALNKVLSLSAEERARGLIAASAGNHGQGVALAAKMAGAKVTVYVPQEAAQIKVDKMYALGAEVVHVPGQYGDAEATAIRTANEQGRAFVSPYNDSLVIAGQGTLALELAEQCPDTIRWLIPVGGGGLIAGMIAGAPTAVSVIGVQSEASPYLYHEFHYRDMSKAVELPSLADGLSGAIEPGSVTIEAIHGAADVRLVTEAQIAEAIAYAFHAHGHVIEGSGAVGLAAVLSGQLKGDGRTVVLISGGNIDPDKHRKICERDSATETQRSRR